MPAALALVLIAAGACGERVKSAADHEAELLADIRRCYLRHFEADRPDYVVITYPETAGGLPPAKWREYKIIKSVLDELRIPHESKPIAAVLTRVTVGRGRRQREGDAFEVSGDLGERLRGGTVLFLNLEAPAGLRPLRNPLFVEREITVRFLNDPISIHAS